MYRGDVARAHIPAEWLCAGATSSVSFIESSVQYGVSFSVGLVLHQPHSRDEPYNSWESADEMP